MTKHCSFTNLRMLFTAMVMNFPNSNFFNILSTSNRALATPTDDLAGAAPTKFKSMNCDFSNVKYVCICFWSEFSMYATYFCRVIW